MQIDKNQILDLLRQQGSDKVSEAEQQLPDQVDPEKHADLLSRFGINPQDLLSKFGGGGLGGLLGG